MTFYKGWFSQGLRDKSDQGTRVNVVKEFDRPVCQEAQFRVIGNNIMFIFYLLTILTRCFILYFKKTLVITLFIAKEADNA